MEARGGRGGHRAFSRRCFARDARQDAADAHAAAGVRRAIRSRPTGAIAPFAGPLFNEYLLAFEVTSVLLLAAIVGAVVLGRQRGEDLCSLKRSSSRPCCSRSASFGVLIRRNAIIVFMCVELMLNAVNLTFVAFAQAYGAAGQVFVFFVMTVAAAEAAVGLAIIIALFRHRQTVNLKNINLLKG